MKISRTRIKICGLTRVEDALALAHAGADAIGLNFYAPSPRAVSRERAVEIRDALPPFVTTVALFVNEAPDVVKNVIDDLRPALLQFHGDESEDYCAQFALPYLKAIRVEPRMCADDLLKCEMQFRSAKALLLDAWSPNLYGGSGARFDWEMIPQPMRGRIVLSGGLTPQNVADAVKLIQPWAVDVSSGVESSEKGIKDHHKITQFIEAVKNANV